MEEPSGVPQSSEAQGVARAWRRRQAGFSLAELLVATTVLMIISGITMTALLQMTASQQTIWNRTQMHAGVRSAFELLQQEVGQAGRVALPGTATLTGNVAAGNAQTVTVSTSAGMFEGMLLVVGAGQTSETVTLLPFGPDPNTITANFFFAHDALAPVTVYGGFASGIVPPTMLNGSTGTVLKLYGDINSDGSMMYIEYTCDTGAGKLYRNSMNWNAPSKPVKTDAQVLLSNLQPNPGGASCFSYPDPLPAVSGEAYVTNVALTLTVRTEQLDPVTKQHQTESQTINLSPRNVVNVWELATLPTPVLTRIQPMPQGITNLLP